jgi:hypothetical protein
MLFSVKVMQHVHPNEFEDYFEDIKRSSVARAGHHLRQLDGRADAAIWRGLGMSPSLGQYPESRVTQGRRDRGFEAEREAAPLAVRVPGDAGRVSHYA